MVARLAWRNLWRNPRRTWLTGAAIFLNTWVVIVVLGLMEGFSGQLVTSVTGSTMGTLQLHHPEYLEERSIHQRIHGLAAISQRVEAAGAQATARVFGHGLLSGGGRSAGASFWGVLPEAERRVFDLARDLREGAFLGARAAGEVVLGSGLARSLDAEVGGVLVVMVQAADGSLGNRFLTVTGVLAQASSEVDAVGAFIHVDDFRELFVVPDGVHEVAVRQAPAAHAATGAALAATLNTTFPGVHAQTWEELLPMLASMRDMSGASVLIFGLIFYTAAAIGVGNTMLMAAYERSQEFAVLRALGTTPLRVLALTCTEGAWLGGIFGASGGVVAGLVTWRLQHDGISLARFGADSMSFGGVRVGAEWAAVLRPEFIVGAVLGMVAVTTLAAGWASARSAWIAPAQAMARSEAC